MPHFKLFAEFQLSNQNGSFTETVQENIEAADPKIAETFLETKISGKISAFSEQGLNWTLLEKSVVEEHNTEPEIKMDNTVEI